MIREARDKRRALPQLTLDLDISTVQSRDFAGQGKSQSRAIRTLFGGV